jgi:hypothetical protein
MRGRIAILACCFACLSAAQSPGLPARDYAWKARLGADPIYAASLDRYLASAAGTVRHLPDPRLRPARENWQPMADTASALVNVYRLSGNRLYLDQARQIADWLLQSNDYLVAHRDRTLPYLGWGPETRTGYFKCADVPDYHADDLWDTASVLRCLLKLAPFDPRYLARAKRIIDAWPYVDRQLTGEGPYAAAGLRWYRKSNEPCEIRYVKNTNIAMGEQLFRLYLLTRDPADFDRAVKVLHTQLWDVVTRHNLAYTSCMTYLDHSDPSYAQQAAHNDRKVLRANPGILCGAKDDSCWNHLGYEGYAMFNIGQLVASLPASRFPVASTKQDIANCVQLIMNAWRQSSFGDTRKFDWASSESTTHITAYNCAQRFSADPTFERECRMALVNAEAHGKSSATAFFSLVPESLAPGQK